MILPSTDRSITTAASRELLCPQCETGFLTARHCKRVCDGCGYVESCEDNFVPNRATPPAEPTTYVARSAVE